MHARIADVPLADRPVFSLGEVAGLTGFSLAFIYELNLSGHLRTRRVGRRRIVTAAVVAELLGEKTFAELFGPNARCQQQPLSHLRHRVASGP
jgi:hypothetical protein